MWNRSVDEWKHALLTHSHLIEYLLRHVDELQHLILTKDGLDDLTVDLHIPEGAGPSVFLLRALVNDLVHIVYSVLPNGVEEVLQRVGLLALTRIIPLEFIATVVVGHVVFCDWATVDAKIYLLLCGQGLVLVINFAAWAVHVEFEEWALEDLLLLQVLHPAFLFVIESTFCQ